MWSWSRRPQRIAESGDDAERTAPDTARSRPVGSAPTRPKPFGDHLPPSFRDRPRRSAAELALAIQRTSPDEIARFGVEKESQQLLLRPGGRRHLVVGEVDGGRLEVDRNRVNSNSHAEFVSTATGRVEEADAEARHEAMVVSAARRLARPDSGLDAGFQPVPVEDVGLSRVRNSERDQTLVLKTRVPAARLQATWGVSLEDFDRLLELHPDPRTQRLTRRAARKLCDALARSCHGIEISKDLRGFIEVLAYYITEGQQGAARRSTAHARFLLMLRSDFHAIYLQLLSDEERALVDVLLLSPAAGRDSLVMRTLGKRSGERVFREKYLDSGGRRHRGPTYAEWFDSIVNGRGRGPFAKDALSPPPGFRLHTGNRSRDYGMGAMGVDVGTVTADPVTGAPVRTKGKVLFEIRKRAGRSDPIVMNAHMRTHVKREFRLAASFNPEALGSPEQVPFNTHEEAWVDASETVLLRLDRHLARLGNMSERRRARALRLIGFADVAALAALTRTWGWKETRSDLDQAFTDFERAWERAARKGASSRRVDDALRMMERLLDAMWDIDAAEPADAITGPGRA